MIWLSGFEQRFAQFCWFLFLLVCFYFLTIMSFFILSKSLLSMSMFAVVVVFDIILRSGGDLSGEHTFSESLSSYIRSNEETSKL